MPLEWKKTSRFDAQFQRSINKIWYLIGCQSDKKGESQDNTTIFFNMEDWLDGGDCDCENGADILASLAH